MAVHDADPRIGPLNRIPKPQTIATSAVRRVLVALLTTAALALALFLLDILALSVASRVYPIDVGTYRGGFFLTNVSGIETDSANLTYRWTQGETTFRLAPTGVNGRTIVTIDLGGRPAPGTITLSDGQRDLGTFTASATPQRIRVLVPQHAQFASELKLYSDTFSAPNDSRVLGLKLHRITLSVIPSGLTLPPLVPFAAQLIVLVAGWVVAGRLSLVRWAHVAAAAAITLGLAIALAITLPVGDLYFVRLAVVCIILALATILVLPRLEQLAIFANTPNEARLLWAIMLASCMFRLVGSLFPTFSGQDFHYHIKWFDEVLSGDLFLAVHSSEFAGGAIVYPPGTYVTLSQGVAFTNDKQGLLQGFTALIDGTGALFVALLAYRLGLGRLTARLSAVLFAGSLPTFTALAYGFSAQVFSQWFMAPLALALIYAADDRRVRAWALASLLLLFSLLTHVGVAILAVSWFGTALLFLLWRRDYRQWWAVPLFLGAGVFSVLFVYSYGLEGMLAHGSDVVRDYAAPSAETTAQSGTLFKGLTPLMFKGARLAYSEIGLILLPIGVWLLARTPMRYSQRAVAGAAFLVVGLYFVVDLLLALQVRYFYFIIPFALVAIAYALQRIAQFGRWGKYAAWVLALVMCAQGTIQWWMAAFGELHLSLTPLTH